MIERVRIRPGADGSVVAATLVASGQARVDELSVHNPTVALGDVFEIVGDDVEAGVLLTDAVPVYRSGHGVMRLDADRVEVQELGYPPHRTAGGAREWLVDVADATEESALRERVEAFSQLGHVHTLVAPLSGLSRAADVMHRVRAHCVWTADMTHELLLPYLIEESYELIDAVESGSAADVREELGDLLWQVLFHAEVAGINTTSSVMDEIAHALADKMVHRHPHVFAGEQAATPEEVLVHWNRAKAAEKPERKSVLDGVPRAMPALSLAQKVLGKASNIGVAVPAGSGSVTEEHRVGEALLAVVADARAAGIDAEAALRHSVHLLEERIREAEANPEA